MEIGLTYDLRSEYLAMGFSEEETAEFDKEETIEGIEKALNELGYKTDRIGNIVQLSKKLVEGKRWDMVFNIAEGMYGIGREAQVPALLDAYNIPYVFSDVLVLSLTLHKGLTKRVIRDCNIPTADFFVLESIDELESIRLSYPLFVKPVAEGTGKGISDKSLVTNKKQLSEVCTDLLKTFNQPVLIETFLPGREFTVGISGTGKDSKAIGVIEVVFNSNAQNDFYSYESKRDYEDLVKYVVPEKEIYDKCCDVALRAWKAIGCRDGGRVDLKNDIHGIPNFIEVNPLAGLNYVHSDLPILAYKQGYTFNQLIKCIMDSAIKRIFKTNIIK